MPDTREDILVIAPEGMKAFIRALGVMRAIRRQNEKARITALVAYRFIDLAQRSGYFDETVFSRGGVRSRCGMLLGMRKKRFTRVHDLRTRHGGVMRRLLRGHPVFMPPPKALAPDVSWMTADVNVNDIIAAFGVEKPYVLLLAGASRHAERNWLPRRFVALAMKLAREGFLPVVTGTDDDADMAEHLMRLCPQARDICGLTSLCDLAALAREAGGAIGADTGAADLCALAGCPTQVIAPEDSVGTIYRAFAPREKEDHAA